jgi:hypothetical protein
MHGYDALRVCLGQHEWTDPSVFIAEYHGNLLVFQINILDVSALVAEGCGEDIKTITSQSVDAVLGGSVVVYGEPFGIHLQLRERCDDVHED